MANEDKKDTPETTDSDKIKPINIDSVESDYGLNEDDDIDLDDLDTSFLDDLEEMGEKIPSRDTMLMEEKDEKIAELEAALAEKDKTIIELKSDNSKLKELVKSANRQHERLQEQFSTQSERNIQKFIKKQYLPTVDSLENALTYIKGDEDTKGIKGILTNCYNNLATLNIEKIDAEGQTFNPEFHEALAVANDASKDDKTVLIVQETGYKNSKTNTLIRPSKVIVNKLK